MIVTQMSAEKAKKFFLKNCSYCNIDLPPHFDFYRLIKSTDKMLNGVTTIAEVQDDACVHPNKCEGVNYTFLSNKDGKYAWRPFSIIHPVLYCLLINLITKEENWEYIQNTFKKFASNTKIRCIGLPIESEEKKTDKAANILNWWEGIEQESIKLSLKYKYIMISDVTDCYGAIYTYSIPWGLHGVKEAKEHIDDESLLGNQIATLFKAMNYGNTIGLPQGSVINDLVAEMILGRIDDELIKRLRAKKVTEYKMLRFRDDYRIFSNSKEDLSTIACVLTELLSEYHLKINSSKTFGSSDVIQSSLKADKLHYVKTATIYSRKKEPLISTLQKELLYIYEFSLKFPNSGTVVNLLNNTFKSRFGKDQLNEDPLVLISIIVDIMHHNNRVYSVCIALISKLFDTYKKSIKTKAIKQAIVDAIVAKFSNVPNTAFLQIWLQRLTLPLELEEKYDDPLCLFVSNKKKTSDIWNSDWLAPYYKKKFTKLTFVDKEFVKSLPKVFDEDEISLFSYYDRPLSDETFTDFKITLVPVKKD